MVDRYQALERLSKLKADGVLTDDEFAAEKAKLLSADDTDNGARPPQPSPTAAPEPPSRRRWLWLGPLLVVITIVLIALGSRTATSAPSGNEQVAVPADRIPACDSADAKQTLTGAIEHSAAEKIASIRVLDIAHIVERSYDPAKPSRVCAADLTLNSGDQHTGYEMHLNSDGSNMILQMVDDPGPTAAPASSAPSDNIEVGNSAIPVAPAPAAPSPNIPAGPTSIVSENWLTGPWYDTEGSGADCTKNDGEEGHLVYGADHSYAFGETAGTWRLDGTTIRTHGESEGDPFDDNAVITRADIDSFSARDVNGIISTYRRCPR